jgi:HEAT repeat protein
MQPRCLMQSSIPTTVPVRARYPRRRASESGIVIRALEPLVDAARNGTAYARAYALTALGAVGDTRAFPLAVDALTHDSPLVRVSATKSLRYFRESSAVPGLIQALSDADSEVRCAAASTLGLMQATDAVTPLMAFYERGDQDSKMAAIRALGQIGDPRSLPLARAALVGRDRKVRDVAKLALARYDLKRRHGA